MRLKGLIVLFAAVLTMALAATAQDKNQVNTILEEIDAWVTTDTTRILAYIDSNNAITEKTLESSEYWQPTISDLGFLLGIDYVGSPQIDNTGRIYFMMRITGESEALFYIDGPMGWPHQLTPNNWAAEGFTISSFNVHPSGDFMLVSVHRHGDEMHDVWHFTRDGKFKPLIESRTIRYHGAFYNDDNPDEFFLRVQTGQGSYFAQYTISTGQLDSLYSEPGAAYPMDYNDGKLLFVRYFSFSENQIAMVDLATKEVTDLSEVSLFWGAAFTDDGRILALTSIKSSDEEYMKICLTDPADPKKYEVLFDPKKETDDYLFIKKTGQVVLSLNNDGYSELVAFDLAGQPLTVPQPEIGVLSGATGNDLGDVVFGFSSPKFAPTAFKFTIGGTDLVQLGDVATFGVDFSGVEVEVIRYKSDDGTEIPALLYIPEGAKKDGTNPAIVQYHGGPPGQSRPYFQRNIAFALSKGFIVMFPNVRGSTGYGPAYERADNLEGRWASLIDCERALDYLINEGWSNPDKIAVWGASYGGYVVNWLATQCPEKIACVVSQVGVSDVDHTNRNSFNQDFAKGWEKEYGPVGSDLTHKLSPIFYAEKVTKPMMITAGFYDPRVPPSDPRRFFYVLKQMGKPVWYYEETEAGHGGSNKEQVIRDLTSQYVFTMMHVM